MRWPRWCFLAAGAALVACSHPPPAAPVRATPPAPTQAPAAAWPDVARSARVEKSGARDAAVVVAVERRAAQPNLAGVRVSGEDWTRFFPRVLGVPPDRVTPLFDADATRAAVSSAVRAAAARVAPGARLWFVAVGYGVVDEADIAAAAIPSQAQVISVLDVVRGASADLGGRARAATSVGALAPITFSIARPILLPGASRPALSYLLMGALRGWGDRDHDGRVTASEAASYADLTLRLLSPHRTSGSVSAGTDLVCSALTTLSVGREPGPKVLEIVPRAPPGAQASPEVLASALEAVRAVDARLAAARASGSLKGHAEVSSPRFIGRGDETRVEVAAMPDEVEAARRVRLEHAKRLGGAAVREAAALLVEAGRTSLAYGRLEEAKEVLTPVLEARCGADAAGLQAWESLLAVSHWTSDRKGAARLASMNCAYDEASALAIDGLFRLTRGSNGPDETARQLYARAEQETAAPLARCTWSAVAETYAQSWWSDPVRVSHVEAALNGAYAFSKLGRTDDAAALYRSYLDAQGRTTSGESDRYAQERRAFSFAACSSYFALAKKEPRFLPGYFDRCAGVSCTGIDRSVCAQMIAAAEVPALDSSTGEPERARQLTLAARDREELAGWEATDAARAARLREASERYAVAEAAWGALVDGSDATPDPAEAARRVAEAAVRRIAVDLEAGAEVTETRVENARKLLRRARAISGDERRVEPARLLVELADGLLARERRAFVTSGGQRGVSPRSEVRIDGEGERRRFVTDELPLPVAAAIAARDEYLAVPATFDAGQVRYRFAYEAGRLLFLYGHFDEARQRLKLPYTMECGISPIAHDAWVLLLSIANLEGDITRAQSLMAEAADCATDVETRIGADRLRKPIRGVPFVLEARRQLQASEALADGPQRRALRREAAAIFRHFVRESPDRGEGPEAARVAAELYLELGEEARALEMYRLFVDRYGANTAVTAADVEGAYAALELLHARLGDYRARARVLLERSEQKRLPASSRAAAARKARELRKNRDGRGLESVPIGG